ncbi:hypothetical protein BC628DRAFT_1360903 [Trametes gibbosa]|nr:hypothetical protein BC628DRAFT_1360903 [Trametes gibbosa]
MFLQMFATLEPQTPDTNPFRCAPFTRIRKACGRVSCERVPFWPRPCTRASTSRSGDRNGRCCAFVCARLPELPPRNGVGDLG